MIVRSPLLKGSHVQAYAHVSDVCVVRGDSISKLPFREKWPIQQVLTAVATLSVVRVSSDG
jgi:hypothetical protein